MKGGRASPVSSFGGTRKKGQVWYVPYVGVRAHDIGKIVLICPENRKDLPKQMYHITNNKPIGTIVHLFLLAT